MAPNSNKKGSKDTKAKPADLEQPPAAAPDASKGNGRQEKPGSPSSTAAGPRITLTGAQQTNLTTLCARAQDARQSRPLLNDRWALHVLDQVPDYNFAPITPGAFAAAAVVKRALILDQWAASFLEKNPRATVIHLACGLDSRCLRLRWGAGGAGGDKPGTAAKGAFADVCWVDLDFPDVIALRKQLLPSPSGPGVDYRLVAASVTESDWLNDIPSDRPTLIIMEGLTMYLAEKDGISLLRRLLKRFPSGSIIFDCVGSIVLRAQGLIGVLRYTGATFGWAIDYPRYLELLDERMRLVETAGPLVMLGILADDDSDVLPVPVRWTLRGLGYVPYLRAAVEHVMRDILTPGSIVRFEF
ncbi:hypothetical protein PG989_001341 [Apiospora arundinis]